MLGEVAKASFQRIVAIVSNQGCYSERTRMRERVARVPSHSHSCGPSFDHGSDSRVVNANVTHTSVHTSGACSAFHSLGWLVMVCLLLVGRVADVGHTDRAQRVCTCCSSHCCNMCPTVVLLGMKCISCLSVLHLLLKARQRYARLFSGDTSTMRSCRPADFFGGFPHVIDCLGSLSM